MFVSKKEYKNLCNRMDKCEKQIKDMKTEINTKAFNLVKKILREPEKLSEEIEEIEKIDIFIDEIINH